jgi:hypothetical protein
VALVSPLFSPRIESFDPDAEPELLVPEPDDAERDALSIEDPCDWAM